MEEKERYKLNSFDDIYDNEFDDYLLEDFQISQLQNIVNLLNQQDKQIKENEQLKQQLHDLPKKIVEEIRTYCNLKEFNPKFVDKEHQECVVSYAELIDFLDTILEKVVEE